VRRLARILLNTVTVLSLLLCVATVVLWVRSYQVMVEFGYGRKSGSFGMGNAVGEVVVYTDKWPLDPRVVPPGFRHMRHTAFSTEQSFGPPNRRWGPVRAWTDLRYNYVGVRYWPILVASAALPTFRLIARARVRRSRLRDHGLCSSCGYDLRATPDRCPECGTIPGR